MNFIMVPLDQVGITDLEDLGNAIGAANVSTVSIWDAASQAWKSATYLEFLGMWVGYTDTLIGIGDPVMVGAKTEALANRIHAVGDNVKALGNTVRSAGNELSNAGVKLQNVGSDIGNSGSRIRNAGTSIKDAGMIMRDAPVIMDN